MIDLSDLFELYEMQGDIADRVAQGAKVGGLGALQADSSRRLTQATDRLGDLEKRYERISWVTAALWQLLWTGRCRGGMAVPSTVPAAHAAFCRVRSCARGVASV